MKLSVLSIFCSFFGGSMVGASDAKVVPLVARSVEERFELFRYREGGVPMISAHRGANVPGYPENTIAAMERCLNLGPMIFEVDPRLSKDRQLVLIHDATLDRTTEAKGRVDAMKLDELCRLSTRDVNGKIFPEIQPPSLDDVIVWAKGKTILNLDIKDSPKEMRLDNVRKHQAFGWVIFTVHDAKQARWFYEQDSRCGFAAVIFDLAQLKSYEDVGVPWKNIAIAYVGPRVLQEHGKLYEELHQRGVKVMISTCPSADRFGSLEERAEAYREIFKAGVDILETDRPEEVKKVMLELLSRE